MNLLFSQYLRDVEMREILSDLSRSSPLGVDNVQVSAQVSQQLHHLNIPNCSSSHQSCPLQGTVLCVDISPSLDQRLQERKISQLDINKYFLNMKIFLQLSQTCLPQPQDKEQ